MNIGVVLLLFVGLLFRAYGETLPKLRPIRTWRSGTSLRGGAPDPANVNRFYTWGEALQQWDNGRPRRIASASHGFDEGGCALDLDGDGRTGVVLVRRPSEGALGDLLFYRAPSFNPETIDTNVELHDCLAATLAGRQGFLLIHRHAQVRFYWRTAGADGKWSVEEIYSIYTASRQSGLALADVDGDKRTDIYAGNYWVRSPESAELPWHIFAIHLHNETDDAASFSYAAWPDLLVGVQRGRSATPVRLFRRPSNPRELWPETSLGSVRLDDPRAALAWGSWAVLGHRAGFLFADPRGGNHDTYPAPPVLALWTAAGRLYVLSERQVAIWSPASTRHPRGASPLALGRIDRKPRNLLILPPGAAGAMGSASPRLRSRGIPSLQR